jgi:hypothetical protein
VRLNLRVANLKSFCFSQYRIFSMVSHNSDSSSS